MAENLLQTQISFNNNRLKMPKTNPRSAYKWHIQEVYFKDNESFDLNCPKLKNLNEIVKIRDKKLVNINCKIH